MSNEVLDSWILRALRNVIGYQDVRKDILRYFLRGTNLPLIYGPTFTIGVPEKKLFNFLDDIIDDIQNDVEKIILFTCNNSFGSISSTEHFETHYQTFVINTVKKTILMIDPSRKRRHQGIYSPSASMMIFFYISSKIKCKFNWMNLEQPCQIYDEDIFCQSWSLYLQIYAVLNDVFEHPSKVVPIPTKLSDKYQLLLDFYKKVIQIPAIQEELYIEWRGGKSGGKKIKSMFEEDPDAKKFLSKQEINNFKEVDIIETIENMKSKDIYEPHKGKIIPQKGEYYNKVSRTDYIDYEHYIDMYDDMAFTEHLGEMLNLLTPGLKTPIEKISPMRLRTRRRSSPRSSP